MATVIVVPRRARTTPVELQRPQRPSRTGSAYTGRRTSRAGVETELARSHPVVIVSAETGTCIAGLVPVDPSVAGSAVGSQGVTGLTCVTAGLAQPRTVEEGAVDAETEVAGGEVVVGTAAGAESRSASTGETANRACQTHCSARVVVASHAVAGKSGRECTVVGWQVAGSAVRSCSRTGQTLRTAAGAEEGSVVIVSVAAKTRPRWRRC